MLLDMTRVHVPVLAGELIELLDPQPGELVVDCTFGAGGHARLVAERIGPTGTLIAIDRDPVAEEHFDELAAELACQTRFIRASFADGLAQLRDEGVRADIVYLDLGMSSMQVDTRERGFSYSYDAPLDMRMDPDQELSARELVNEWDERRLARILRDFGEERYAGPIARAIVRVRAPSGRSRRRPSSSRSISSAIPAPARFAGGHPAKRSFQAIRIAVNDELAQLDEALPLAWDVLRREGRFAGISFHSRRRPPREALPRRPRAWLHLPAGPAGLRLRPHPGGRAADPPRRGADPRRGRRQPPIRVRAPARRAQARMTPPVANGAHDQTRRSRRMCRGGYQDPRPPAPARRATIVRRRGRRRRAGSAAALADRAAAPGRPVRASRCPSRARWTAWSAAARGSR